MNVLMVARYFTPQHGPKGWSEGGDTSGVAHITKGRGQGPCSITIQTYILRVKAQCTKPFYFSKIDPKIAITYN